ncbi:hypothetical protein PMAYCL1PPCAC_22409, partial [Pristionchus mayeri]
FHLYPSNLPFYGVSTLDSGRFTRLGHSIDPGLRVILNGPEDSVVDQVYDLLSSSINDAVILGMDFAAPADFSFCAHLLRNSTIFNLQLINPRLDDTIFPHILSLAAHTVKEFYIEGKATGLSNPASFISQLYSTVSS